MAANSKYEDNEELTRLTKTVYSTYMYFQDNYKRFRDFKKWTFKSSVSDQQKSVLSQLNRPIVEFNILESSISRLLGEFSKHEPGIVVSPAEGVPVGQQVLDLVEGHLRHIMHTADKDNFSYNIYKDMLAGGFSVAKVWTDYASPMSFEQQIYHGRVFDPTLCGFDPMARTQHKGDGQYSFEIYPMLDKDFKRTFPGVDISRVMYHGAMDSFQWSYVSNDEQKYILVCEYYEKKKKKTKIVKLANGRVMTAKGYKKLEEYWEREQFIEQIPVIVGEPRMTELETICCYTFIESQILRYQETDYTYLPHVFFDGNSEILAQGAGNNTYQMTRPYIYQAKGVQDMVNFGGQTLCNSMENLVQHKFIVMKEAIPQEKDYLEALSDMQRANTIVVNAYSENNPEKPIPTPIREVQNLPLPPEVMQSFQFAGAMSQTILGSYASNLGKNDNDLSGKAVIESSSVGNSAAMPYIVGYLAGLTQVANIEVDLMPKYLVGPRTIPVMSKTGERSYEGVNRPQEPRLDYEERAIKVNVEAGVNFQVQKTQALEQIVSLMGVSEQFSSFMNSPQGLEVLISNLNCYGSDRLKEAIPQWMQQQQQMQQQAQQNNPQMQMMQAQIQMEQQKLQIDQEKSQVKMQELQLKAQQQQIETQLDVARLAIEKEVADAKVMEAEAKVSQAQIDSAVRLEESQTSLEVHALESATKMAEIHARQHDQVLKHHKSGLEERRLEHDIEHANKSKEK